MLFRSMLFARILLASMFSGNLMSLFYSLTPRKVTGRIVDVVAEDMLRAGVEIRTQDTPHDIDVMLREMRQKGIANRLTDAIRWARLYGGSCAVILIEGQDMSTPLDISTIRQGSFLGLHVLNRWQLDPSLELITELGPRLGQPVSYRINDGNDMRSDKVEAAIGQGQIIHHSRVIRFIGIELPYNQRRLEGGWGASVVERIFDRLQSFDSATIGGANLLFHAYLRVVSLKGFRDIMASNEEIQSGLMNSLQFMQVMQHSLGLSVIDSEDSFQTYNWTFSGIADALQAFAEQISGGCSPVIPLVILLGQSPKGFSSGDNEVRLYYDGIRTNQEDDLRPAFDILFKVMHRSLWGEDLPANWTYEFRPLWQLNEKEKAEIATIDAQNAVNLLESGLFDKATSLKELKESARATGRFDSISDDTIRQAEALDAPPSSMGILNSASAAAAPLSTADLPASKRSLFSFFAPKSKKPQSLEGVQP